MPRRNHRNQRRSAQTDSSVDASMRAAAERTVTLSGTYTVAVAATNSVASTTRYNGISLSPNNLGTRLLALSDAFMAFRFTKLEVSAYRGLNNPDLSAGWYLGFSPAVPNAAISSLEDVSEYQNHVFLSNYSTVPIRIVMLRRGMAGFMTKWLRTRPSSTDDQFEYQGTLTYACVNSTTNPVIYLSFRYTIQFRDPVPTAVTGRLISTWADIDEEETKSQTASSGVSPTPRASVAPIPGFQKLVSAETVRSRKPG